MDSIGYMPEILQCVSCGAQEDIHRFSSRLGGIHATTAAARSLFPYDVPRNMVYASIHIIFRFI